jgi:hypothetical protein
LLRKLNVSPGSATYSRSPIRLFGRTEVRFSLDSGPPPVKSRRRLRRTPHCPPSHRRLSNGYLYAIKIKSVPLAIAMFLLMWGVIYQGYNAIFPSLYPELFPTRTRVTAVAIAQNVGTAITAPLPALFAAVAPSWRDRNSDHHLHRSLRREPLHVRKQFSRGQRFLSIQQWMERIQEADRTSKCGRPPSLISRYGNGSFLWRLTRGDYAGMSRHRTSCVHEGLLFVRRAQAQIA